MLKSTRKKLPENITSYDLLKTFAVVLMIVDHIGFYLFPEHIWFRVFGRMCVPAWFFLVGYANSRDLSPKIWIGAAILVFADFTLGYNVLPVNILFTIIIVRLLIDDISKAMIKNDRAFWAISFLLLIASVISYYIVEYGALGVVLALYGYFIRNKGLLDKLQENTLILYAAFSVFALVYVSQPYFGFSLNQNIVMTAGIAGVMATLYRFKSMQFPDLTKTLPDVAVKTLHFMGRRTLEIYVAHLLVFKILHYFRLENPPAIFDLKLF